MAKKIKEPKPTVQLSGQSDNVFSIIGRTVKALKRAGQTDNAEEFQKQARQCKDYDAVLQLCDKFCEVS